MIDYWDYTVQCTCVGVLDTGRSGTQSYSQNDRYIELSTSHGLSAICKSTVNIEQHNRILGLSEWGWEFHSKRVQIITGWEADRELSLQI